MSGNKNEEIESFNELDTLCKDEIILMDGPIGTMVQKYKLVEEDYREFIKKS